MNDRFIAGHLAAATQRLLLELVDVHRSAEPRDRYFITAANDGPTTLRFLGRGAAQDTVPADRAAIHDLIGFGLLDVVRPGQVDWYQVSARTIAFADYLREQQAGACEPSLSA